MFSNWGSSIVQELFLVPATRHVGVELCDMTRSIKFNKNSTSSTAANLARKNSHEEAAYELCTRYNTFVSQAPAFANRPFMQLEFHTGGDTQLSSNTTISPHSLFSGVNSSIQPVRLQPAKLTSAWSRDECPQQLTSKVQMLKGPSLDELEAGTQVVIHGFPVLVTQ